MDARVGGAGRLNEVAPPAQRARPASAARHVKCDAWKVINVDARSFVYRFDGVCKELPQYTIYAVSDPRSQYVRFRKAETLDLPIPLFVVDNNSVGLSPKREVSIYGLNDNINESFLRDMCEKVGPVSEVIIYRHPRTKKHMGMALVVFEEPSFAALFVAKTDGCSVMGGLITCFLDPYASKISRRYEQVAMEYAPIPNYLRGVDEAKLNELRRILNLPRSPDEALHDDQPSCSGMDRLEDAYDHVDESFEPFNKQVPSHSPCETTPRAACSCDTGLMSTPKTSASIEAITVLPSAASDIVASSAHCPPPPAPPPPLLRPGVPPSVSGLPPLPATVLPGPPETAHPPPPATPLPGPPAASLPPPPPFFLSTHSPVPPSPLAFPISPVQAFYPVTTPVPGVPLVYAPHLKPADYVPPPPPPTSSALRPISAPKVSTLRSMSALSSLSAPPLPPPTVAEMATDSVARTPVSEKTPIDPSPERGQQEREEEKRTPTQKEDGKVRKRLVRSQSQKLHLVDDIGEEQSVSSKTRPRKRRHPTCSTSTLSSSGAEDSVSEAESDLSVFQRKMKAERRAKKKRHIEAIFEEKRKYYKRRSYAEGSKDYYKEVVIRTLDEPKDRKDTGVLRSHGEPRELVQEVERYQRIRRYKRRRSEDMRTSSPEARHMRSEPAEPGEIDLPDLESVSSDDDSHRRRKHRPRRASCSQTSPAVKEKDRRSFAAVNANPTRIYSRSGNDRKDRVAERRTAPFTQGESTRRKVASCVGVESRNHRWSSSSASEDSFSDTDEPSSRRSHSSKRMTRRRHKKVKIDERDAFNKRRMARKVTSVDLMDLKDMMEEVTNSSNESSDEKITTASNLSKNRSLRSMGGSLPGSSFSSQTSLMNAQSLTMRPSFEQRLETLFHSTTPSKQSTGNVSRDSPQTPSMLTPVSVFTPVICDSSPAVTPIYSDRAMGITIRRVESDSRVLRSTSMESWSALQERVAASLAKQSRLTSDSPVDVVSLMDADSVREMEDKDLAERRKKEEEAKILEAIERERVKAEQEKKAAEEREARRREYERKLELQKKRLLRGKCVEMMFERLYTDLSVVLAKDALRRLELHVVEKLELSWLKILEDQQKVTNGTGSLMKADDSESRNTPTKPIFSGLSPVKSVLALSSKNSLNEMVRQVAAQSKAEMSAAFGPDATALLGSDFLFQGFGVIRNMPSFKKKVVRPASPLIRDRSSDSSRSRSTGRNENAEQSRSVSRASSPTKSDAASRVASRLDVDDEEHHARTPKRKVIRGSKSESSSKSSSPSSSSSRSSSASISPARSLRARSPSVFTAESGSEQQDAEISSSSEYEESVGGESEEMDEESDVEISVEDSPLEGSEPSKTSISDEIFEQSTSEKVLVEEDVIHKSSSAPMVETSTSIATLRSSSAMELMTRKAEDKPKTPELPKYDALRSDHCYFIDESTRRKRPDADEQMVEKKNIDAGKCTVFMQKTLQSEAVNDVSKRPVSPSVVHLKAVATEALATLSAIPTVAPTAIKKARRRRVNNELASILPPPVDVSQLAASDLDMAMIYDKRSDEDELEILYKFQTEGFDKEDLKYLERAFYEMQNDGTATWQRNLFWVPPCETPVVKLLVKPRKVGKVEIFYDDPELAGVQPHSTGCARTEGYYKLTHKQKRGVLRRPGGFQDRTVISERDETTVRHIVQATREARSDNRRLLTSMGETSSDFFKVNQLKYRKKMIKFARSRIHGWGLYALEPITPDEMIVEYVGQKIRPTVADEREKRYIRKGMGSSYLFRIDSDNVIDATNMGNFARFINHSCQPNCYAKVVVVDGEKRIVIYSKTSINKGDEITYDYKFPIEEDKIDCLCGAPSCRGTLN
uniref:[histone H3]-lysine(4) N-trimethyltransferase n=3 Tax=Parascaris TaxID=6254 RepID=A0A915BYE1_PARUN